MPQDLKDIAKELDKMAKVDRPEKPITTQYDPTTTRYLCGRVSKDGVDEYVSGMQTATQKPGVIFLYDKDVSCAAQLSGYWMHKFCEHARAHNMDFFSTPVRK